MFEHRLHEGRQQLVGRSTLQALEVELAADASGEPGGVDPETGVSLLDLGEHQLKGLSRTAHVYQVKATFLPGEFPSLRTGEAVVLPLI